MASRGINKVILVGNLGAKPEIKYASNGNAISNLSVATSESWTDKSTGQKQERTEWHRVSLFGKVAEIAGQYLDKGSKVYVEGKLQTRKWQDQNGQDRYTTEIVVKGFDGKMQMLSGANGGGQNQANAQQNNGGWGQPQQPQQAPQQQAPQGQQMPPMDFDDDISF